jgi:zinc transport system substrate-binding protein
MNVMRYVLIISASLALAGCSKGEDPSRKARPTVYTTFYPTRYFAERIGKDRVEVLCPLPDGADPILWTPDAETIRAYQKADLIIINGAGLEKWIQKVSLPDAIIVDSARPLEKELIGLEGAITHSHGRDGSHTHEGIDGHTWLDPVFARIQAAEIHKGLIRLLPDCRDELDSNLASLLRDIEALHKVLGELTGALDGRGLLASHPAYNYVARRYGWKVTSLELDATVMPDEKSMAQISAVAGKESARIILWETEPLDEIAERLEEQLGLKSVLFSPCEMLSEESMRHDLDYMGVMNENVRRLQAAVSSVNNK